MIDFTGEFGQNAPFVTDLHARWSTDPATVPEDWRDYFARLDPTTAAAHAVRVASVAAIAAQGAPTSQITATPAEVRPPAVASMGAEPLRGVAGRIVRNMEESLGLPTATSVRTISVKLLDENRALLNRHLALAGRPKASYTHFIAWAIVRALREMPQMNAAFAMIDGVPHRVLHEHVNLGIAIDLESAGGGRTLVVPNIRGADTLTFDAFLATYSAIVDRARLGKLTAEDFKDTTLTLTNPGTIGTLASVPRLMPGQGAIIATGSIAYPPEYQAAAPQLLSDLGISKVLTLTSTYDHRVIQGAESGLFLARVEALLAGDSGFYDDVFRAVVCPHRPFRFGRDRGTGLPGSPGATAEAIEKQARVLQLIHAYRVRGSRIADLDPLEFRPEPHPELQLETYGLSVWDLDRTFMTGGLGSKPMATLREILEILLDTYCRRIGVEFMHLSDMEQRKWLQQRMEPVRNLEPFTQAEQRRIIERLNAAEAFERFLHTRYVGHKRFSLEGAETLIPMLDELLNRAVDLGVTSVVMGMAHRGRLNVLGNTFNKSYAKIFSEFEGLVDPTSTQGSGDVKYHLGAEGEHVTADGRRLPMTLACNPSHLEAVNPVVGGLARAKQSVLGKDGAQRVLPVLIHGDAAFAGQGVVAETLNMCQLKGYRTGGTIHIIVNNQIGYTAGPAETRSTYFATDMAKSIGAPILHVNGDYPESALRAIRIAMEWRAKFGHDVVVDMICYRRHGHNETDEPAYTQPLLYRKIVSHPSVREHYGRLLVRRRQLLESEREASVEAFTEHLKKSLESFRAIPADPEVRLPLRAADDARDWCDEAAIPTAAPAATLRAIVHVATQAPPGHHVHPNLARQLQRRVDMVDGALPIDWGCGEALAFGALLIDGVPIRLSGQDSGRGTFSQRHSVIRDQETGSDWVPLNHVSPEQAHFEVIDSLLSEEAVLGFEYGYATERRDALCLWEAQFGDFVNGAQIQIDQFIAASEAKWRQKSGIMLLLPHGYDGQGPEHSSARLERFLQLCAEGNMTVVNCSTPASWFHLLRRQGLTKDKRPVIAMTPKSLLKKREAGSAVADFASGRFEPVLGDPRVTEASAIRRVLLCSGKVYYDLDEWRTQHQITGTAIVRVEQLYPVPRRALLDLRAQYPNGVGNLAWVQEEPKNMGAWSFMAPRLAELGLAARHVGRPAASSPATGSLRIHQLEQLDLCSRAFTG